MVLPQNTSITSSILYILQTVYISALCPELTVIYSAGSCRPDENIALTRAEWVKRRLDKSIEIHNAHDGAVPIVCLGGGSPHKQPLLSMHGHVIHEGNSLAAHLVQKVRKEPPVIPP